MVKHFTKELKMTKEDNENFTNFTKCWIWDDDYLNTDVKVRDHCHITRKYRGSTHRGCNINLELNHKISIVSHNLKDYDSHLIMLELGKFLKECYVMLDSRSRLFLLKVLEIQKI